MHVARACRLQFDAGRGLGWRIFAPASADASPTPEGLTVTCNVDPAKAFKGQKATDNLAEQARAAAGAASVRVIRPNQPVTMDYRGDRLNVITDDADMITEVNCG